MAKTSITVIISGKKNVAWLRSKVVDGNYSTEAEAATDSIAILREEQERFERKIKKDLAANSDAQGHYIGPTFTIEEVKRHLEDRRKQRATETRQAKLKANKMARNPTPAAPPTA